MIPFALYEYRSRGYWRRLSRVWPYGKGKPDGIHLDFKILYR